MRARRRDRYWSNANENRIPETNARAPAWRVSLLRVRLEAHAGRASDLDANLVDHLIEDLNDNVRTPSLTQTTAAVLPLGGWRPHKALQISCDNLLEAHRNPDIHPAGDFRDGPLGIVGSVSL